jgi:hypothetical protein
MGITGGNHDLFSVYVGSNTHFSNDEPSPPELVVSGLLNTGSFGSTFWMAGNGLESSIINNGVIVASGTLDTEGFSEFNVGYIGENANEVSTIDIVEICVYDHVLNEMESTFLTTYFSEKYDLYSSAFSDWFDIFYDYFFYTTQIKFKKFVLSPFRYWETS